MERSPSPDPIVFRERLANDNSIDNVLRLARTFLSEPLHPCDHCNDSFAFFAAVNAEVRKAIADYTGMRKHPELFDAQAGWREEWFDSSLWAALRSDPSQRRTLLRALLRDVADGVFCFKMFSDRFCAVLLAELDSCAQLRGTSCRARLHRDFAAMPIHAWTCACGRYSASGLPVRRPNSMNNYGVIVNDIGFAEMLDRLQREVLLPVAQCVFGAEAEYFDTHHSFVVQYQVPAALKAVHGAGVRACVRACVRAGARARRVFRRMVSVWRRRDNMAHVRLGRTLGWTCTRTTRT
jgi:hypothetical protein